MPESQLTLNDRVPKVSRKVRTCTECRRQKVKCVVLAERQTCTRCERNSLTCRFNKSLQTILEEDTEYVLPVKRHHLYERVVAYFVR